MADVSIDIELDGKKAQSEATKTAKAILLIAQNSMKTTDALKQLNKSLGTTNTAMKMIKQQADNTRKAIDSVAMASTKLKDKVKSTNNILGTNVKRLDQIKGRSTQVAAGFNKIEKAATNATKDLDKMATKNADARLKEMKKEANATATALKKVKTSAGQVSNSTRKMGKNASGAARGMREATGATNLLSKGLDGVGNRAKFAAASFASLAFGTVTIGAFKAADSFQKLSQRIKVAAGDTGDFNKLQADLLAISQSTGIALDSTASLFQRIAISRESLGVTNDELVQFVETIQQLGTIGGDAGPSFQAALVQLSQGLSSGVLRGQELLSLLEQAPVVVDAIATGLGVTRGEFAKLSREGKITAEQVFGALLSQTDAVAARFATIDQTFEASSSRLKTAFQVITGSIDESLGLTNAVSDAVDS